MGKSRVDVTGGRLVNWSPAEETMSLIVSSRPPRDVVGVRIGVGVGPSGMSGV